MTDQPTTAVIGAGISGLTAGKALSDRGLPYTCFEACDDIGGNWYFGNPNGRSSAYRVAAHRHLPRQRQLPRHADGRRLPGLPAPRADQALPGPLRRRLRAARPDPLRDPGRARRAQAGRRLADHASSDGDTQRVRLPRRRQRPPLGPALPGLPRQLRRRDDPLPPLPRARPTRSTCTASACWSSASATAPSTSPPSSRARASPRRSSSRPAAAPG